MGLWLEACTHGCYTGLKREDSLQQHIQEPPHQEPMYMHRPIPGEGMWCPHQSSPASSPGRHSPGTAR